MTCLKAGRRSDVASSQAVDGLRWKTDYRLSGQLSGKLSTVKRMSSMLVFHRISSCVAQFTTRSHATLDDEGVCRSCPKYRIDEEGRTRTARLGPLGVNYSARKVQKEPEAKGIQFDRSGFYLR